MVGRLIKFQIELLVFDEHFLETQDTMILIEIALDWVDWKSCVGQGDQRERS